MVGCRRFQIANSLDREHFRACMREFVAIGWRPHEEGIHMCSDASILYKVHLEIPPRTMAATQPDLWTAATQPSNWIDQYRFLDLTNIIEVDALASGRFQLEAGLPITVGHNEVVGL